MDGILKTTDPLIVSFRGIAIDGIYDALSLEYCLPSIFFKYISTSDEIPMPNSCGLTSRFLIIILIGKIVIKSVDGECESFGVFF